MTDTIKPACPFCKFERLQINDAVVWSESFGRTVIRQFVSCPNCGASGPYANTESLARRWWREMCEGRG